MNISELVTFIERQFDIHLQPWQVAILARLTQEPETVFEEARWGEEVKRDCLLFGNSLHSRINGVIMRTDPATWMINIVDPPAEPPLSVILDEMRAENDERNDVQWRRPE